MVQVSLSGEPLLDEKFSVLGFVPADVVGLKKDVWFVWLNSGQVDSIDQYLSGHAFSQNSAISPEQLRKKFVILFVFSKNRWFNLDI